MELWRARTRREAETATWNEACLHSSHMPPESSQFSSEVEPLNIKSALMRRSSTAKLNGPRLQSPQLGPPRRSKAVTFDRMDEIITYEQATPDGTASDYEFDDDFLVDNQDVGNWHPSIHPLPQIPEVQGIDKSASEPSLYSTLMANKLSREDRVSVVMDSSPMPTFKPGHRHKDSWRGSWGTITDSLGLQQAPEQPAEEADLEYENYLFDQLPAVQRKESLQEMEKRLKVTRVRVAPPPPTQNQMERSTSRKRLRGPEPIEEEHEVSQEVSQVASSRDVSSRMMVSPSLESLATFDARVSPLERAKSSTPVLTDIPQVRTSTPMEHNISKYIASPDLALPELAMSPGLNLNFDSSDKSSDSEGDIRAAAKIPPANEVALDKIPEVPEVPKEVPVTAISTVPALPTDLVTPKSPAADSPVEPEHATANVSIPSMNSASDVSALRSESDTSSRQAELTINTPEQSQSESEMVIEPLRTESPGAPSVEQPLVAEPLVEELLFTEPTEVACEPEQSPVVPVALVESEPVVPAVPAELNETVPYSELVEHSEPDIPLPQPISHAFPDLHETSKAVHIPIAQRPQAVIPKERRVSVSSPVVPVALSPRADTSAASSASKPEKVVDTNTSVTSETSLVSPPTPSERFSQSFSVPASPPARPGARLGFTTSPVLEEKPPTEGPVALDSDLSDDGEDWLTEESEFGSRRAGLGGLGVVPRIPESALFNAGYGGSPFTSQTVMQGAGFGSSSQWTSEQWTSSAFDSQAAPEASMPGFESLSTRSSETFARDLGFGGSDSRNAGLSSQSHALASVSGFSSSQAFSSLQGSLQGLAGSQPAGLNSSSGLATGYSSTYPASMDSLLSIQLGQSVDSLSSDLNRVASTATVGDANGSYVLRDAESTIFANGGPFKSQRRVKRRPVSVDLPHVEEETQRMLVETPVRPESPIKASKPIVEPNTAKQPPKQKQEPLTAINEEELEVPRLRNKASAASVKVSTRPQSSYEPRQHSASELRPGPEQKKARPHSFQVVPAQKGHLFVAIDGVYDCTGDGKLTVSLDNGEQQITTDARQIHPEHTRVDQEYDLFVGDKFECELTVRASRAPPSATQKKTLFNLFKRRSAHSYAAVDGTVGKARLDFASIKQTAYGRVFGTRIACYDRKHERQTCSVAVRLMYVPIMSRSDKLPTSIREAEAEIRTAAGLKKTAMTGFMTQYGGDCVQRRRYFVLDDDMLIAHSQSSFKPRATINLRKAAYLSPEEDPQTFAIHFRNGAALQFRVETDRQEWMQAIDTTIHNKRNRSSWVNLVLADRVGAPPTRGAERVAVN